MLTRFSSIVANSFTDNIWTMVDSCRRDTNKQPKDEPCRFCGNICTSWKKLTVHLAKHMEQISMPILPIVEKRHLDADSIISPVVEFSESRRLSVTPNRSPSDKFAWIDPNSTLAPGLSPYGQYPQDTRIATASSAMRTYPPPQIVPCKDQHQMQIDEYANHTDNNTRNYTNQTYPGLQVPSKSRGVYTSELQTPTQRYHNGNMQNGSNHYMISTVSGVQQQQAMFTNSPIETTELPSYFTQEPQNLANDMTMSYDSGNTVQYQQQGGSYPAMQYTSAQNGYQYQGR